MGEQNTKTKKSQKYLMQSENHEVSPESVWWEWFVEKICRPNADQTW